MKFPRLLTLVILIAGIIPLMVAAKPKPSHHYAVRTKQKQKQSKIAKSKKCGQSQTNQNREADKEGLERIANDERLRVLIAQGTLIPLPETGNILIDPRLGAKWRFTRIQVRKFLLRFAHDFHQSFGNPLQVDSAVRTKIRQREILLKEHNINAASADGPCATSHTTGSTIDISKVRPRTLSRAELKWIRSYLDKLRAAGEIEYADEWKKQAVFHIMVYENYR